MGISPPQVKPTPVAKGQYGIWGSQYYLYRGSGVRKATLLGLQHVPPCFCFCFTWTLSKSPKLQHQNAEGAKDGNTRRAQRWEMEMRGDLILLGHSVERYLRHKNQTTHLVWDDKLIERSHLYLLSHFMLESTQNPDSIYGQKVYRLFCWTIRMQTRLLYIVMWGKRHFIFGTVIWLVVWFTKWWSEMVLKPQMWVLMPDETISINMVPATRFNLNWLVYIKPELKGATSGQHASWNINAMYQRYTAC